MAVALLHTANAIPSGAREPGVIRQIKSLSAETAAAIVDAGVTFARDRGEAVCVVVLDEAGRFLAGRCMDGVAGAAFDVAFAKAAHSARFRRATSFQEDLLVNHGKLQVLGVPGMTPLAGGRPAELGGSVVGSVGVSGASSETDDQIAAHALSLVT